MVALLGSLLWTYLELWVALAVVAIAVQSYFPARVYVPKRFRNQSETNRRMLQLLRSWVKRLDQRVSSIRLRRTMRCKHERCLRIALGHGSQRTSRKRSRRLLALLAYSASVIRQKLATLSLRRLGTSTQTRNRLELTIGVRYASRMMSPTLSAKFAQATDGSRDLVGHAPPTSRPGPYNGSSKMTTGR
jgi:hypothetical protein